MKKKKKKTHADADATVFDGDVVEEGEVIANCPD